MNTLDWWPLPVVVLLVYVAWSWWREEVRDELSDEELRRIHDELAKLDLPGDDVCMRVTGPESDDVVCLVVRGADGKLRRPQ